jgi:hypothetical protein
LIQTIYTQGICIYTSSSQEIFLPRVRANTSGKMQLLQEIADFFKIWKTRDHLEYPGYTWGRRPKNRLRLRTQPGPILPSSLNVRQKAAVATLCTLWGGHTRQGERGGGGSIFGSRETKVCPLTVIFSLRSIGSDGVVRV